LLGSWTAQPRERGAVVGVALRFAAKLKRKAILNLDEVKRNKG
jgi:hypothetical protein